MAATTGVDIVKVLTQVPGTYVQTIGPQPPSGAGIVPNVGFDPGRVFAMSGLLNVSALSAGTLDVYFQHSVDGTNWDDFIHITQVTGAVKTVFSWFRDAVPTSNLHSVATHSLAAGVNNGPVGDLWRVQWVTVTGNASFVLTVKPVLRTR